MAGAAYGNTVCRMCAHPCKGKQRSIRKRTKILTYNSEDANVRRKTGKESEPADDERKTVVNWALQMMWSFLSRSHRTACLRPLFRRTHDEIQCNIVHEETSAKGTNIVNTPFLSSLSCARQTRRS